MKNLYQAVLKSLKQPPAISIDWLSQVFHLILTKFVKTQVLKVFSTDKIREIDEYTILHEPVTSIDLMERAAQACTHWIIDKYAPENEILVFCGPGNNGGDGLAIARQIAGKGFQPKVYIVSADIRTSEDFTSNFALLTAINKVEIFRIDRKDDLPSIGPNSVVIDAIFGSGLSRKAEGLFGDIIRRINSSGATVVAIDIPSGLFGEENSGNDNESIIKATHTLTFQFPKLAFFFSENRVFTGEWHILPIGLHKVALNTFLSLTFYSDRLYAKSLLKNRAKFSHKGNFGHGLLIAGSYGMMGAAVLASRACMKAGAGLVTSHLPGKACSILQTTVPESLISLDESDNYFTKAPALDKFTAVAVGPAISSHKTVQEALYLLLTGCKLPMVIDADAINIIGEHKDWLKLIPSGSILTPHPREFDRLFGQHENSYERNRSQIQFSKKYSLNIVLKGAYTSISFPDGSCWFNSTGNSGMATAGSGDVLTGIILSLLAQGYESKDAAILGTYIHGLAGDLAAEDESEEGVTATDIINHTGKAFKLLRKIVKHNEK